MPTTDELPPEPPVHPNIEAIIALLKPGGDVENAEKAQGESMSTIGNLYRKIEKDLRGNRAAVSAIRKMQKMSADKRNDYIRTLEPLLVAFKYTLDDIYPDLVDQSGGGNDGGAGDDDDDDAPDQDPPAGDNSGMSALERARQKLSRAPAPHTIGEDEANAFVKGTKKPALAAAPKTGSGPKADPAP